MKENTRLQLEEPQDYFSGLGATTLPTPRNVLMFVRRTKNTLQQEALQNRSHHRFVLAYNLGTAGHIHVDNLALPFDPGQALLILPYQFHHFSLLAATQLEWVFCTFELEPRTFLEPLRNRVITIGEATQRAYEALLQKWHQSHAETVQAALLQLLLELKLDRLQTGNDLPPEPEDNLLRSINGLMAEWRGRTVVVADLAQAMEFSESRLRVLFKEAAGIPLGSYIQNYRINRAMALLRTSALSIADVAEEAGFGSPQAFSRIFKKETGHTPRAYRSLPNLSGQRN
ncbi:Arabinose operon regulatory protein [Pontiella desulfatans]|uniref:Arabinose operon regulatory protein n=1 Tax=Pontiella desulfatans TaxID=2750659 RepID=A0A6C2U803_PONDE|nr:helix-turn-helix transcriptional regulator [Pontiella desulfatans]VGO15536.1 Arabinose operon regulatory protein [Pontiella desulfatans]